MTVGYTSVVLMKD